MTDLSRIATAAPVRTSTQRLVAARRVEQRPPQAPEKQRDHGQERHLGHHEPRIDEGRQRGRHRGGRERPAAPRQRARPQIDDHDRDGHQQRLERLQHHQPGARAEGRQRSARQQRIDARRSPTCRPGAAGARSSRTTARGARRPSHQARSRACRAPATTRNAPRRRRRPARRARAATRAPAPPSGADLDLGKLTSSGCAAGRAQRSPRLHGDGH